jgi:hypothetical protein
MEPSLTDRIPPPAWAGRPQLLRVLGERYAAVATLCIVGLAAGAAAVMLAQDRLSALITIVAAVGAVGAVTSYIEVSDLRTAAAEAPVTDERPPRAADRGEYVAAAVSWHRMGALVALLPLDHSVGSIDPIGRPVLVGAAGLLIGLGIAAWAGARWVRRWEIGSHLTLYLHDVRGDRTAPAPDLPGGTRKALTPEETARVQRSLMSGQGLDDRDRDILARIAAEKARSRPPEEATSRSYVVVPHSGRTAAASEASPASGITDLRR